MKNRIKWLDVEYCDRSDETVQPVLINDTAYYVLFDRRGYNYVFATIWQVHLFWSGFAGQYMFTTDNEKELVKYLEEEV